MDNNYIFPFLWMRGEPEEVIREVFDANVRMIQAGNRKVIINGGNLL